MWFKFAVTHYKFENNETDINRIFQNNFSKTLWKKWKAFLFYVTITVQSNQAGETKKIGRSNYSSLSITTVKGGVTLYSLF